MINFKNTSIGFLLSALVFWSCDKTEETDPQLALQGVATYKNIIDNSPAESALKNQVINVTDMKSSYLYQLNTDTLGRFYFPGWSVNDTFLLQSSMIKNTDFEYNIKYTGSRIVTGIELINANLSTTIDTSNQQTLLLTSKDSLGGIIPNASVLIYTSRVLASIDTSFLGSGAIASLKTNKIGKCATMQIPSDSLFIIGVFPQQKPILKSDLFGIKLDKNFTQYDIEIK